MAESDKAKFEAVRNAMGPMIGLVLDCIVSLEVAGSVKQANVFGMFDHLSDAQYDFVMSIVPVSLGGNGQGPEREEIWREMVSKHRKNPKFVDQIGRLRMRIAMLEAGESDMDIDAHLRRVERGPSRLRAMLNEMHESMHSMDED